jgi:hypothetical protein
MAGIGTLLSVLIPMATAGARIANAQDRQPIISEKPKSYFSANFSKHAGQLFLDPGRPAGVFVGYPGEGQDMSGFIEETQTLMARMFLNGAKDLVWSSMSLPGHQGIDESGILFSTFTETKDVQLAFYSRVDGIGYGYFAMRARTATLGPRCPDGQFLDPSGGGVAVFEAFAQSIRTGAGK